EAASIYRRNLWRDSNAYVEVWCEKDALAKKSILAKFAVVGSEGRSGLELSRWRAKSLVDRHGESHLALALFIDQRVRKKASCVEVQIGQRLLERCNNRAAAIPAGECFGPICGRLTSDYPAYGSGGCSRSKGIVAQIRIQHNDVAEFLPEFLFD